MAFLLSPTREEALKAVRTLIHYIGDDPDRHGLRDTPERVIRAWEEAWGARYNADAPELSFFRHYDQMVLVRDIRFCSMCEHHMAPFYGVAHIGYLPSKGTIGLSKLARVVAHLSAQLHMQEALTQEIAKFIFSHVAGVGVVMHARHMCMISRGVQQHDSVTTTSVLLGSFREPAVRAEFLSLTGEK